MRILLDLKPFVFINIVSADSKVFRARADTAAQRLINTGRMERITNKAGVVFYARSVAHRALAKSVRTREIGIKL